MDEGERILGDSHLWSLKSVVSDMWRLESKESEEEQTAALGWSVHLGNDEDKTEIISCSWTNDHSSCQLLCSPFVSKYRWWHMGITFQG